jgi:hypothetical protein
VSSPKCRLKQYFLYRSGHSQKLSSLPEDESSRSTDSGLAQILRLKSSDPRTALVVGALCAS